MDSLFHTTRYSFERLSYPLLPTKEERAYSKMRAPKSNKLVSFRTYVIVDGRYSVLGTNTYDGTDTTEEYLEHYISQRKAADHITVSMYKATHRNRSKSYATPKASR
jgi:hypothetical protein